MSHTPGPWHVEEAANPAVVSADDTEITICSGTMADEETVQANARLIGAAPDLLSVLEEILDRYDDHEWRHGYDHVVLERAEEVVRKAKGE